MSWQEKSIGQICEVIAGQSPKGEFYNDNGNGLPFYQGKKDFGKKYIGAPQKWTTQVTKEAESGDVLMSVRAPVGPVNFAVEKICIGRGLAAIRAKGDIDRNFLFYGLLAKQSEISGNQGAVFSSINKKQIESIPFLLPSLPEQKRIVAILDKAFEGIDTAIANTEKNLANARELFDSCLYSAFNDSSIEWKRSTIDELVEDGVIDKPLDGNHGDIHPKKADFVKSGIPFIMASDLENGLVNQKDCNFITEKQAKSLRKGFAKNEDVLLSHKGTIGRVAVLSTKCEFVMLTPQVTYYRVLNKEKMFNRYLYYYFQSPLFQRNMKSIAGAGSTRAYIGITKQRELSILYPEIEHQKAIVKKLDTLRDELASLLPNYEQKLTALSELKQSILNKAFSGELTTIKDDELRTEEVA